MEAKNMDSTKEMDNTKEVLKTFREMQFRALALITATGRPGNLAEEYEKCVRLAHLADIPEDEPFLAIQTICEQYPFTFDTAFDIVRTWLLDPEYDGLLPSRCNILIKDHGIFIIPNQDKKPIKYIPTNW